MKLVEAIELAVEQAQKATGPFRHGCAILNGKKLLSKGHNHVRRHVGTLSIHAELDALWKIYDSDLYDNKRAVVVRVNGSGRLANSRPCSICMNALRQHGVHTVVYSTVHGGFQMERICDSTPM